MQKSMQKLASDATAWKSSMIIVNAFFFVFLHSDKAWDVGGVYVCVFLFQGVEWTPPL